VRARPRDKPYCWCATYSARQCVFFSAIPAGRERGVCRLPVFVLRQCVFPEYALERGVRLAHACVFCALAKGASGSHCGSHGAGFRQGRWEGSQGATTSSIAHVYLLICR
jgi:hypothetical protein